LGTFVFTPNFDQFGDIVVDFALKAKQLDGKSLYFICEFGVMVGEDVKGVGFEL
jgi:hypothetical protein